MTYEIILQRKEDQAQIIRVEVLNDSTAEDIATNAIHLALQDRRTSTATKPTGFTERPPIPSIPDD